MLSLIFDYPQVKKTNLVDFFGADCELGYGYDPSVGCFLPFDCKPLNVERGEDNIWTSSEDFMESDTPILNQNYLNVLENRHIFYGNEGDYCNIFLRIINRYEICRGCDKYPENISGYICERDIGLHLNVTIRNPPLRVKKLHSIVNGESKLHRADKNIKCSVIINGKERHEWTLKELVKFCRDHSDDEKYQCPVDGKFKNINEELLEDYQSSELTSLLEFLKYLYLCYRKIEIISTDRKEFMTSDNDDENMNPATTETELTNQIQKTIDEYKKCSRDDLNGYGISMKKLFQSYRSYLEYCALRENGIDNIDAVVGDVDKLKSLLNELNSSSINNDEIVPVDSPKIESTNPKKPKSKENNYGLECHHKTGNQKNLACSDCGGLIPGKICCQAKESIFDKLDLICSSKKHSELHEEEEKLKVYKKPTMNKDYAIKDLSKKLAKAKVQLNMYSKGLFNLPRILNETDEEDSELSDESSMEVDDGLEEGEII